MSLDTPLDPFTPTSRRDPGLLELDDLPVDDGAFCPTCFRNDDECPGHDEDRKLLDLGAQLVRELSEMRHPVPKAIVRTINAIEDHIRLHNPEFLNERY